MSVTNVIHNGWDNFTAGTGRVARGTMAGFIGGIAAAWVMNQYQAFECRQEKSATCEPVIPEEIVDEPFSNGTSVAVAQRVSREVFAHELTTTEKQLAGPALQYGSSALAGAVYGGLAEIIPSLGRGFGVPYATMLWFIGDQLALPALGITRQPIDVSPRKHASTLARRFIYGISLDLTRRLFRRII